MQTDQRANRRVIVVGGGITGLAAAHRLATLDPTLDVTLLEAGDRLGGVIQTVHRDGFLIERSADSFITARPAALDLCRQLGLENELIETDARWRRAWVVRRGKLLPIPRGFLLMQPRLLWPMVTTRILSLSGKLRLAGEYFVPRRTEGDDESLASFARRRLGREAFERLVQPLVGGIYTADPEKLSMAAALPRMLEMEQQYGGLLRAARAESASSSVPEPADTAARYSAFMTLRQGLGSLIETLAGRLEEDDVRLGSPVQRVARVSGGGWTVEVAGQSPLGCRHVILATPAHRAARLLEGDDRPLADELAQIPYAGASIVCLGYRRNQIAHPLDGFGLVVPAIEGRRILAASFSSVKFPGRAPDGHVLIRVFVGGALQPELVDVPEEDLVPLCRQELAALLGAKGEPVATEIARWHEAMPQYHLGHLERVRRIEERAAALGGLHLAGNAYHGVGIPQCIASGQAAADQVFSQLAPTHTETHPG